MIFQSRKSALNQLKSSESVTDYFPLVDLLHEKKLKIGKAVVTVKSTVSVELFNTT